MQTGGDRIARNNIPESIGLALKLYGSSSRSIFYLSDRVGQIEPNAAIAESAVGQLKNRET